MSLILDEHRQYLSDPPRLAAFDRAIRALVRPTDIVIDLGCGTGILGLMACRAGARRVYAIDDGGMIGVAAEAARRNGFGDRIVHIAGKSTRVDVPERANVIVSDQIGRLGFEAGLMEFYDDARRRLLAPDARVLPERVTTWAAPVEQPALFGQVEFWKTPRAGFDFAFIREAAVNTGYPHTFTPGDLLAPGAPVVAYDIRAEGVASSMAAGTATFEVTRPGLLHGLAGWFAADLVPGVVLTNAPGAPDRIERRHSYLPVDRAVSVIPGDQVSVTLRVRPADVLLSWRVAVTRRGERIASFDHTTLRGMLISQSDLVRTRPDARPRAGQRSRAAATVIGLADGTRTLREIEALTYERHPDMFTSAADVAAFVSGTIGTPPGTP